MCVVARDNLGLRAGDRHEGLFERTDVVYLVERQVLHRSQHTGSLREHKDAGVLTTVRLRDDTNLQFNRNIVAAFDLPVSKSVTDDLGLFVRAETHDLAIELYDHVLVQSGG